MTQQTGNQDQVLDEVMEQEPETLYKILNALNFHAADDESKERAKRLFANCIKKVYLIRSEKIPEDVDSIFDDIIRTGQNIASEIEEIKRLQEYGKHQAYVKEHDLTWVLEVFKQYTEPDSDDDPLDDQLDHEFIYYHHHDLGLDFPSDPELVIAMFVEWLESIYSI